MWGKHGLCEMFCNDNEVYCFKFKHEEDKPEPDKVSLWVKMFDIPLEAWSHKGFGRGRIGFARVMIEIDAKKPFKDRIDVQYRDKTENIIRTKHIRIEYSWKPTVCDFCSVFGHSTKMCSKRPKTKKEEKEQQKQDMARIEGYKDGYVDNRRKQFQQSNAHKRIPQNNNVKGRNEENKEGNKGYNDHNDEGSERNINAEQMNEEWQREMISLIDNLMMELNTINNLNMELKLASWIIRGMGIVDKQDEIQRLILENNLSIIAILETKAKGKEIDRICSKVFNRWNWSTNMNNCNKGYRIAVGWDTNVIDIHVLFSSWQVTFCLVETVQEKTNFLCSFVYAANNGKDRVELWKDLALQKQIDFKDCVSNNELEDICSSGFQYTWTKSPTNPKGGILKKLDRAISNEKFITDYELAHAVFLPYIIFDHCPCLINIPNGLKKNGRTFRFINYIADKPEFILIVKKEWKLNVKGFQMYRLEKLKETQAKIDKDPFNSKIREEVTVILQDYKESMDDEYKLMSQKAKIQWLKEGDKNNAYFHKVVKGRKHRSRIESICDENKMRYFGDEVPGQFVKHFQNFLGVERLVQPMDEDVLMFIKKLDVMEASNMIKDITDKEIQEAMFDIDNDKAPGPDGYTFCFFKKAWNVVGMDVCLTVKQFFQTGKLLKEMNATIISLIPKLDTPNKVSDFRPIACCDVLYKCISKDNILLTQELLKGYNKKNGSKRCALKIDLQKAYDTVIWSFLKIILERFGFHDVMINWIMTCISTSAFSISVNGQSHGYFKGARGLRQGDPISPYIFTLVMKVLNLFMIKNIKVGERFKYHAGCKDLQMTHICFADDLMVFCNGDVHSITVVKKSLNEFSRVSGLFPNLKKSTIFFGSVNGQVKQEILKIVEFSIGKLPMRYFGVPLLAKCLSVNDCRQLIDKVKERIRDWKNIFLSYAGRLQLISSVLASMQTYWASIYLIPKTVVKEIDKMLMGLRDKMKRHVIYKIGNGLNTCVWFDKWDHNGPLSNFITKRDIYDARFKSNNSVAELIEEDRWKWPSKWLDMFLILKKIQVPSLNDSSDKCSYFKKVWSNIKAMINLDQVNNKWKDIIEHLQSSNKHNNIRSILKKIGVSACVYMIYNERNSRTFSKGSREEETLTKIVKDEIRWKLASLNVKRTAAVKKSF
nr:hypothetical protein [Tanacetum cinerariifolium]